VEDNLYNSTFRILVVDEDRQTANYIAGLLQMFGYHALPLYSLSDVLENVGWLAFNLALVGCAPPPHCGDRVQLTLAEILPDCKVVSLCLQNTVGEINFNGSDFDYFSLFFRAEELLNVVRGAKLWHQGYSLAGRL
jgi:hypothetical protein